MANAVKTMLQKGTISGGNGGTKGGTLSIFLKNLRHIFHPVLPGFSLRGGNRVVA